MLFLILLCNNIYRPFQIFYSVIITEQVRQFGARPPALNIAQALLGYSGLLGVNVKALVGCLALLGYSGLLGVNVKR